MNLTNEQRDKLAEALFYARSDAAIGILEPDNESADDYARFFMALTDFLSTVGIKFDGEDLRLVAEWEPK